MRPAGPLFSVHLHTCRRLCVRTLEGNTRGSLKALPSYLILHSFLQSSGTSRLEAKYPVLSLTPRASLLAWSASKVPGVPERINHPSFPLLPTLSQTLSNSPLFKDGGLS